MSTFYNLPTVKSTRATSFGYGDKIDISKKNVVTPSPLNYAIYGDFDRKNSNSGITIGAGRDVK